MSEILENKLGKQLHPEKKKLFYSYLIPDELFPYAENNQEIIYKIKMGPVKDNGESYEDWIGCFIDINTLSPVIVSEKSSLYYLNFQGEKLGPYNVFSNGDRCKYNPKHECIELPFEYDELVLDRLDPGRGFLYKECDEEEESSILVPQSGDRFIVK